MKKTLDINLGGSIYHIDEDAYHELMDYLQDVKRHLGDEASSEEVLNDIEQRIGELFMQWMQGKREVVTVFDVQKVIDVLGRPEQYDSMDGEARNETDSQKEENHHSAGDAPRKLYRDTENAVLGGVCSGFAIYMNVSVVLVRLFFVFLIFFWLGPLLYIICWLIMPEARTAAQRLEMRGKKVNIDNIEKKVREDYEKGKESADNSENTEQNKQKSRSTESVLIQLVRICGKAFLAVFAGFFILLALMVLVALVIALVAIWSGAFNLGLPLIQDVMPLQQIFMNPVSATFVSIGLLFVIGIPFFAIFRLLFGKLLKMKPARSWEIWVGLLLWFVGIGLCTYFSLSCLPCNGGLCI